MSLVLHSAPRTCSLATIIALEEAGADYTLARVDFASTQQRSPGYLALNPKGRVPALVTERGVITETPALLLYVAQRFPAAGLAPLDDPFELGRVQAFTSYLCSTVHVAHAHNKRGHRWADDEATIEGMRRAVPRSVTDAFLVVEHHLLAGPWVMGDRYSICDGYLFTVAQWLEGDGVDLAKVPRVVEHRRRMAERPAVVRALERAG